MVTPALFRQAFNEFRNPAQYSDELIVFWINVSLTLLDINRWGDSLDYGTMLYVAHRLAIGQRDALTVDGGGTPGASQGVLVSKSVDKVSASYDVGSVQLDGAGAYNATRYGTELWKLMGQFGAGGFQQGGPGFAGLLSW